MAIVLRGSRGPLRVRCGRWLRLIEAWGLALLLSVVLSVPTVRAQTLSSDGSLNWGITSTGPSTSSVNGTALVITAAALTLGFVATGGATATMALTGRALSVAGSTVGPIAATMLRQAISKGPLTGAMLALAAVMGSDAVYNAGSNSLTGQSQTSADRPGNFVNSWGGPDKTFAYSTLGALTANLAADANKQEPAYNHYNCSLSGSGFPYQVKCYATGVSGGPWNMGTVSGSYTTCPTGATVSADGKSCITTVANGPASDAQLSSALQAPAALAKVWEAGGCPQKITTYRDTASADDPCAKIVNAPGGSWTPVSVPNGGTVSLPGKTEVTKDAAGNVTGTRTVTPTAQVAANTNPATMGASPVIVTPGQVVTNSTKNADGSTTTTTTTTTNPSQSSEQPQDGGAVFNAGDAALYNKKSKTFGDVLTAFQTTLNGAPWMQAAKGFFTVSFGAAACPHWTVPANRWVSAPLDAGVYFCSSTAQTLYTLGGMIVLAVAAWAAFRIAFL